MPAIDLVVFDMAGTTVVDDDVVTQSFLHAVQAHQIQASREQVLALMGQGKRSVFRQFYEAQGAPPDQLDVLVEAAYATFCRRLEDTYRSGEVREIPGTSAMFAQLKHWGIKIATTTGFYRVVTDILLERLQWRDLDVSVCDDDVPRGRPTPFMLFRAMERTGVQDVRRVVKVGDTPADLLEGTHAGCRGVIGVLSGTHDAVSLGRHPHTHLLPSVRELPALLDSQFS